MQAVVCSARDCSGTQVWLCLISPDFHWQNCGSCCRQGEAPLPEQLLQGHGVATLLKLKNSCQTFYFCLYGSSFWADSAGAEVQHLCGLVVLWCPPVRDAHWPIPFPWPRWGGAFPVHPHGQPLLPSLAGQGCKGHFGEGKNRHPSHKSLSARITIFNLFIFSCCREAQV